MTTHHIEIRLKNPATDGIGAGLDWFALTREPISKRDAEKLLAMVNGRFWQARIVSVDSPMGDAFGELERRVLELYTARGYTPEQVAIAAQHGEQLVRRWERVELAHHPDCKGGKESWNVRELAGKDRFTGMQWINFLLLRQVVSDLHRDRNAIGARSVVIDEAPRVHTGYCPACGASVNALSIFVRITKCIVDVTPTERAAKSFPGRMNGSEITSSREYAL